MRRTSSVFLSFSRKTDFSKTLLARCIQGLFSTQEQVVICGEASRRGATLSENPIQRLNKQTVVKEDYAIFLVLFFLILKDSAAITRESQISGRP